ncbi:MAG TPA: DoxX family protein [Clostridia bacterium]|nr:DoxX family protein [Clostridia bacterium]
MLATDDSWAAAIARVTLGGVVWAHGAQKLLGWFGGHGPQWYAEGFSKFFGIPPLLTWGLMLTEAVGMLLLVAGFAGRLWAALAMLIMLGAIHFAHLRNGFYMNWYGDKRGEGFEYHLLALALCAVVLIMGSGAASVDRLLMRRTVTEPRESAKHA